jgi:hypothetical protein
VRETLVLAATLRRGVRRGGDSGSGGSGSDPPPPPPPPHSRAETTRDADAAAAHEVERALRRLGLTECADTLVVRTHARICTIRVRTRGGISAVRSRVFRAFGCCVRECARAQGGDSGGHAVPGISGGERRRLAIGAPLSFTHTHTHDMRMRAMRAQMSRIHS